MRKLLDKQEKTELTPLQKNVAIILIIVGLIIIPIFFYFYNPSSSTFLVYQEENNTMITPKEICRIASYPYMLFNFNSTDSNKTMEGLNINRDNLTEGFVVNIGLEGLCVGSDGNSERTCDGKWLNSGDYNVSCSNVLDDAHYYCGIKFRKCTKVSEITYLGLTNVCNCEEEIITNEVGQCATNNETNETEVCELKNKCIKFSCPENVTVEVIQ